MSGQQSEALEKLKSEYLDAKVNRDEFLEKSAGLGALASAYDWLNEANPDRVLAANITASDGDVDRRSLADEHRSDIAPLTLKPKPDQYAWTFGGAAALTSVKPGQLMRLWTEDAFAGKIRSVHDLPSKSLEVPFLNPQTGPFYVEGAEVGDTLAIHFIDVQPARDWAASTTIPLFGGLTATSTTQLLNSPLPERVWIYQIDRGHSTVLFRALDSDFTVEIPIEPMLGTVGVAPKAMEVRNALVPDAFGGNMDSPEVKAGTTMYLGVNVEGALFSIGDGHYAQSEGETCGVAVEGAMSTTCVVDVIKGGYVEWPRLENDEFIMVAGSARPLEDAFRIAFTQLVRWLSSDFGLSTMDAYQLISQVAKTQVANVVDTNYTMLAKFPKRYLPKRSAVMGGVHGKLRRMAGNFGADARAVEF
ncbi:MAG: acetamidase/formamidase family protein [Candidatus Velthaea sp.]